MEDERIAYVAPDVVDLGPFDALYGGDPCGPVGSVATGNCETGGVADEVCTADGSQATIGCVLNGSIAGT
jgi:hypothetical protein